MPESGGEEAELPLGAARVLCDAGYVTGASPADDEAVHAAKYPPGTRVGFTHPTDPAYDFGGGPALRMPAG